MNDDIIDLLGQDIEQDVENLPEGNALGTTSTWGSASTSSCPAQTVSTLSSWGCLGCLGKQNIMTDDIDLSALDASDLEALPEGNALGCTFSASTTSTSSCLSSAASLATASTLG